MPDLPSSLVLPWLTTVSPVSVSRLHRVQVISPIQLPLVRNTFTLAFFLVVYVYIKFCSISVVCVKFTDEYPGLDQNIWNHLLTILASVVSLIVSMQWLSHAEFFHILMNYCTLVQSLNCSCNNFIEREMLLTTNPTK